MTLAAVVLAASITTDAMPFVFPQSDVTIVYVTGGTGGVPNVRQTLRVSAAFGLERVDAPGGGLSVITDTVHRTTTLLDNTGHTFRTAPAPPGTADMRGRRAAAGYAPAGRSVVAGLPCAQWTTHDPAGRTLTVCLTADGVLTRASVDGATVIEAASVERVIQDPALFAPPPSWREDR